MYSTNKPRKEKTFLGRKKVTVISENGTKKSTGIYKKGTLVKQKEKQVEDGIIKKYKSKVISNPNAPGGWSENEKYKTKKVGGLNRILGPKTKQITKNGVETFKEKKSLFSKPKYS